MAAWLVVVVTPCHAAPKELTGTVTWVYDADTLRVDPHGRVRLIGIDAPEKSTSDRDLAFTKLGITPRRLRKMHGAGLAWAIQHAKGQTVTLVKDQTERDRHGRLLAYVRLANGRLLNRVLLEEGLVIVYRRFPFASKEDFLAAEALARQRGIGLWAP
jgi:micrococcal nuclease